MNKINAKNLDHKALNESIREGGESLTVEGCCGQRFIAAGMSGKDITIEGIPGNALGAYLNGGTVSVLGNAQDAVGDTMNEGRIIVHGSIGDAAGRGREGRAQQQQWRRPELRRRRWLLRWRGRRLLRRFLRRRQPITITLQVSAGECRWRSPAS